MDILLKLCGVRPNAGWQERRFGVLAGAGPLLVPMLILVCALRWELVTVASLWSVMILPGVLAMNAFVPVGHVMGFPAGRFAMGSLLGLLPFALFAWIGCIFHLTLTVVLWMWGPVYVGLTVYLVWRLMKVRPEDPEEPVFREGFLPAARVWGIPVVVGCLLILVGVAVGLTATWPERGDPDPGSFRAYWLWGLVLGLVGSLVAGVWVFLGTRGKAEKPDPKNPAEPLHRDSGRVFVWLLRLAVLGLVVLLLKLSYGYPPDTMKRPHNPGWNSDDVTYVCQAVDYRFGQPLGLHEPSIGSDRQMGRTNWSPFIAPLVGTLSILTGVECAALHHSVLPPLKWLLGISAIGLVLSVTFRRDYWLLPLGMIVCLTVVCKGMVLYPNGLAYDRCFAEFTVLRAMQTKSIHLLWIWSLQLAVLMAAVRKPTLRVFLLALAVLFAGHMVHPFATIVSAVWVAVFFGMSILLDRKAVLCFLAIGVCVGLMGATYYGLQKQTTGKGIASGRAKTSPEQSRDLLRVDDAPVPRQDPVVLFGMNPLYLFAVCGIPLGIAIGLREREMLYLAAVGIVGLLLCNTVFFGKILNVAVPMSILWRGKWLVPYFPLIVVTAYGLYRGFCVLLQNAEGESSAKRSFISAVLAGGAILFSSGQWDTMGFMKPGKMPELLTKFSPDVHGLVEDLGGVEADPFVWGPRTVTRELPQLMPNIRLVMSRTKIIRPADHEQYRRIVSLNLKAFRVGEVPPRLFEMLLGEYPIDTVVIDRKAGKQPAEMLKKMGWTKAETSGRYDIYRAGRIE